jgi:hypothetical protein
VVDRPTTPRHRTTDLIGLWNAINRRPPGSETSKTSAAPDVPAAAGHESHGLDAADDDSEPSGIL